MSVTGGCVESVAGGHVESVTGGCVEVVMTGACDRKGVAVAADAVPCDESEGVVVGGLVEGCVAVVAVVMGGGVLKDFWQSVLLWQRML